MQDSRTVNATRNIFWGVVEKITNLLMPFVLRTIFIKVLGAQYLGLNSFYTSILSVLSIAELGFGSAIAFSMYKPIADGDNDNICALLNLYRKIYRIVGSVILTAGLAIMPWLSYLIKGDCPSDVNIYIVYLLFLLNTVLGYFLFAYKGVLFTAHQRIDILSKLAIIINILGNILKLVILIVIKNYYMYVMIAPIVTIVTNISNAYFAKKIFPQYICRGDVSKDEKYKIRKRVTGLLSFKIYGVIFNSVDTIIISSFLGLIPLAIFNNYYYIQTSIIGFLTIISSSITASIGNKMVTNSKEDNYNDFKNVTFMNAWISGWCTVCLFCLYQHFTTIWVGEEMLFPFSTMVLMVIYFFLPRVSSMTYTYREAAGLWWEDRYRPIVAAIANLSINIILVRFIGINGIIISSILCTVFINIPWGSYILFKNYFKRSVIEYFCKLSFYALVTTIISAITYFLLDILPEKGFVSFIIKGIICVIIPNVLFFVVYHKLPEFDYFKALLKNTLRIKDK